jgi:hypothetical protein
MSFFFVIDEVVSYARVFSLAYLLSMSNIV